MSTRKNALYTIKNKVIEQQDLQHIADLIWKEYQPRHIMAREKRFKVYVKCFENVTYQDTTTKIFDVNSEIYKQRIKSIEIIAECDDALYIKIRLNHGQLEIDKKYYTDSDIEIGGDNFEKIHDIQARFLREISAIKEQRNFFLDNDKYLYPIILILATISVGYLIDLGDSKTLTPYWRVALVDFSNFIIYTGFAAFLGFLLTSIYQHFYRKSVKYWPLVELRIGPEHLRPEVRQKRFFVGFLMLVILPLALAVVYDLCKLIPYLRK